MQLNSKNTAEEQTSINNSIGNKERAIGDGRELEPGLDREKQESTFSDKNIPSEPNEGIWARPVITAPPRPDPSQHLTQSFKIPEMSKEKADALFQRLHPSRAQQIPPSELNEGIWARPVITAPPRPGSSERSDQSLRTPPMSEEELDAEWERLNPPHVQQRILAELRWKYGFTATTLKRPKW